LQLPRLLSEPGPLLTYLSKLRSTGFQQKAEELQAAIRSLLEQPDGAILLEFMDVSTQLSILPVLSDERALIARNAQSLIASDLRRIASDETERLLEQSKQAGGRPKLGSGTRSSTP
jgi:hypothetical protein